MKKFLVFGPEVKGESDTPKTLKKNTTGHYAQVLIIAAALSVYLPFGVTWVTQVVIGLTLCVLPGTRDKIFAHKGTGILLLFCLITATVALIYGNYVGLLRTGIFAAMMVIALVARSLSTKSFYEKLLDYMIAGGVVVSLGSVVEYIIHHDDPGTEELPYRCQMFFINPNFFGIAVSLIILICAYKVVTKAKHVWVYYAAAVINAVGLYFCKSLSLWIVIFIGIVILLLLNHSYKLLAILLGIVITGCVVLLLMPQVIPRLDQLSQTIENRVLIWRFAVEKFKEAPIFGHGFFSYKFLYEQEVAARPELYKAALSHNILLDSLLSHGIVGTALLGAFMVRFFKTVFVCHDGLKKRSHSYAITTFIVSAFVAVAIYGIIDTTIIWMQTGMILLLIASGIGADERELRHITHVERLEKLKDKD